MFGGNALGGLSIGLKILGGAFSVVQSASAGEAQRQALETRRAQEKAIAADKAAAHATKLNKLISKQAVMAGARGLGDGSSVFRQISQDSFDVFHDDAERDRLNLSMQESSINSEMAASRSQEGADIFGAVVPAMQGGARDLLDMYGTPKEKKTHFFGG